MTNRRHPTEGPTLPLPQAQGQGEATCAVGLALGRDEQLLYFIDGIRLYVIVIDKRRLRHLCRVSS